MNTRAARRIRREWEEGEPGIVARPGLQPWQQAPSSSARAAPGGAGLARVHYRPGDLVPGLADPLPDPPPAADHSVWFGSSAAREQHTHGLKAMLSLDLVRPAAGSGCGIVYVGGGRYWPMIAVGLRMARRVTDLPIEVWHSGPTEPVRPEDVSDLTNISFRSVLDLGYHVRRVGGWENKTTALWHCAFDAVLYLDADAYLVADPREILEAAREHRFCFWVDLPWNADTVDWAWSGVVNAGQVPPIQGGQLVLDRQAFGRELLIAHFINQHSEYFYRHQYGDQDSWRIALAATGGSYRVFGAAGWQPPAFVCRYPDPLIVHRCQAKLWGDSQVCFAHDLPGENEVRELYNRQVIGRGTAAEVFGRIYEIGMWGAAGSSGDGSNEGESAPWIDLVHALAQVGNWTQFVDLACGDGRVTIKLPGDDIVAVDVYQPHIERLTRECPRVRWSVADIDADRENLPGGQVALLKDVLQHWPTSLVLDWLGWARKCGKWQWLIICGDCNQATDQADCILGGYRGLDPAKPPLAGFGLQLAAKYLHKSVLLMRCLPVLY